MDTFINLILILNTLFMTPDINNSVCPQLAGFCLNTSFALGLGCRHGSGKDWKRSGSAPVPCPGGWTAHSGGVSAQSPPAPGTLI